MIFFLWILLQLDIAYDKFIRTTESKHEAIVKEFYAKVLASGDIYRADYEGLYCVNCEEYKVIPCHCHFVTCDLVINLSDSQSKILFNYMKEELLYNYIHPILSL